MKNFQYSIFYDYEALIQASCFYRKYDALFSVLDLSGLPDTNDDVGRTGYSRHAILRSLLVKHLEEVRSIPRLIEYLDAHPILTEMCGFRMGCLPDESQFYRFLKETRNGLLQQIHESVNKILVERGIATLDLFAVDSKPIKAATRENNSKNPNRNTTDSKENRGEIPKLL